MHPATSVARRFKNSVCPMLKYSLSGSPGVQQHCETGKGDKEEEK